MNCYEKNFRRSRLVMLGLSALWTILFWFFWLNYCFGFFAQSVGGFSAIFGGCLIWVYPLCHFRVWKHLTDSSFEGIVTDVKRDNVVRSGFLTRRRIKRLYRLTLTVGTDSGKIIKKSIESAEPFYNDRWYVVGDRVRYHRGTKYPLVVGRIRICAYCGSLLRPEEKKCVDCWKAADE